MRFTKIKKENCNSIYFGILFPVGSANDPEGKNGLAHLTEHLCFKKAGSMTQSQIYDQLEKLGAHIDAETGKTYISFQFGCRREIFADICKLLSAMLNETDYSEQNMREEKSVVIAEMLLEEKTNKQIIIDDRWSCPSLKNNVLGNEKTLANITLQDVAQLKNMLFALDYAVVLVGNFDDNDIETAERLFACNNRQPQVTLSLPSAKRSQEPTKLNFIFDRSERLDVYYSYCTKVESNDDALCACVLDNALFRGYKAYVTERLREKFGYIYEIDSNFDVYGGEINWIFNFSVHRKNLTSAIQRLEELLQNFVLDEACFQYVKAYFCDELPVLYDDLNYLCNQTLESFQGFGQWFTPQEFADRIRQISFERYNDFYKRVSLSKEVYIFGKTSFRDRKSIRSAVKFQD